MPQHHLSCHCGAVQLDAELDLTDLAVCNCSICGRVGAIMAFVPADKLSNIVGEDQQTDYQFGPKRIHHAFCRVCGVRTFAQGPGPDGRPWAMVNVRCIADVDTNALEITRKFDGKSL